jgi:hypothetical protein
VRRYCASFSYPAQSWSRPRRVVAKVEWHPSELYLRVADAGCSRAGEIRLVKSTSWRIAGEIVSSGDCIRRILNGDAQWWLFRFGSLRRHRNSEKAGTFAAFSLGQRS